VGAGIGELVLVAQGSSARLPEVSQEKPVDAVIAGIVDHIESHGRSIYDKHAATGAS
jgi:microcompartment protein CcmK/EutM